MKTLKKIVFIANFFKKNLKNFLKMIQKNGFKKSPFNGKQMETSFAGNFNI